MLVSIQALVFVSQPYFNEPGYEMSRGDSSTQKLSNEYNEKLMPHTIKWAMLDQIQNPCPCFKEVSVPVDLSLHKCFPCDRISSDCGKQG